MSTKIDVYPILVVKNISSPVEAVVISTEDPAKESREVDEAPATPDLVPKDEGEAKTISS